AAESLEAVLQHINTPPHDIREAAPDIDEQVAETIMKGLQTDLNRRWQTIDPMLYQFREAQERLFPGKSKKTAPRRLVENRPAANSKSASKPTPGITLAEEGITLAEEQPEDLRKKAVAKPAAPTPGITIVEEGITLAEESPPETKKEP